MDAWPRVRDCLGGKIVGFGNSWWFGLDVFTGGFLSRFMGWIYGLCVILPAKLHFLIYLYFWVKRILLAWCGAANRDGQCMSLYSQLYGHLLAIVWAIIGNCMNT